MLATSIGIVSGDDFQASSFQAMTERSHAAEQIDHFTNRPLIRRSLFILRQNGSPARRHYQLQPQ